MSKYFLDKNALDVPWTESPFYPSLIRNYQLEMEPDDIILCNKFNRDGYVIIDLELTDDEIEPILKDMHGALDRDDSVYHADHFQYTDSKRIFEHWKKSVPIAKLTVHDKIISTLELLYNKEPYPFSTINFIKGSNQPLHSDTIHFHTIPQKWMCGVWVAFEDVGTKNGTLNIVPGSHKWNIYEYQNLKLPHPDDIENGEAVNYREYENFIRSLVKSKNGTITPINLKKGQALIWSANMLHGGCNIEGVTDLNKTRLTQANHYFFKGCEHYYHPMFTDKYNGKYADKWCSDDNNIETYLRDINEL